MTTSPEPTGVLVIDKPEGMTSHDVVARVRRVLRTRKVGHAGTLDPMATGVLVLACGRGTRLLPYLQATRKEYRATVRLGQATSTDDRTGEPLSDAVRVAADAAAVDKALGAFTGRLSQVPSTISAVKVGGRRAYALARAGEQIELPPREVRVDALRRVGALREAPDGCLDFDIEVACSAGTYVRALARDIGAALGCGGHLTSLRRTAVGPFDAGHAEALPASGDEPRIWSLTQAAAAVLPSVRMDADDARRVTSGLRIPCGDDAPGTAALLGPEGGLLAVAVPRDGLWVYRAVFA